MKLHESLRKIVRQFGVSVLSEKRLLSILADFRAFDDYPAVKQVMKALVSESGWKEFGKSCIDEDNAGCLACAGALKGSLISQSHFRQEFADYAVDSLLFAIGLKNSVNEPSDHGFEPLEHGQRQASVAEPSGEPAGKSAGGSAAAAGGSAGNASGLNDGMYEYVQGIKCLYGVRRDYADAEAARWFMKSAELGNAHGQSCIGYMYWTGSGVTRNVFEAERWFRRSAAQGNTKAMRNLGGMAYESGDGHGADKWFRKAKWMYWDEYICGGLDDAEAVKWFRNAAEQGDSDAQCVMGLIYFNGYGYLYDDYDEETRSRVWSNRFLPDQNRCDYKEAEKWLLKSAEQGNSDGQYQLGVMNQRCSNEHGAFEWYRKAAEQGHPDAMESLGMMYESGIGVLRDYVEALKWYRKAADHIRVPKLEYIQKGLTRESQRMLGLMYENGIGVPRDYAMALKWYLKAAEQGDSYAQLTLGRMYENGTGVSRDYSEALKWYRKAEADHDRHWIATQSIERVEDLISQLALH